MARVAIPFVLQSPVTGSALVGDKFTFTKHVVGGTLGAGEAATIYTTETESTTTGSNVLTTDARGSLTQGESASPAWAQYWIAEGRYDVLISGSGLKSVYITRDLVTTEGFTPGPWTALPTWTANFNAVTTEYRLTHMGRVELRGLAQAVKAVAKSGLVAELPTALRPAGARCSPVVQYAAGNENIVVAAIFATHSGELAVTQPVAEGAYLYIDSNYSL
jgi:hypothetical protein